jgi:hypothetical protein
MKLSTRWVRGPRSTIPAPSKKDTGGVMTGKRGGPVIRQDVLKIIEPRKRGSA